MSDFVENKEENSKESKEPVVRAEESMRVQRWTLSAVSYMWFRFRSCWSPLSALRCI